MNGSATMKACVAVWTFDTDNNGQAKSPQMSSDPGTYGSNPLWAKGADGPWYLSAFDSSSGEATFVPNSSYSGPQKPILSKFIELPYSSDTAEYAALSGSNAITVGYAPPQDLPQYSGPPGGTGQNASALVGKYTLQPYQTWQINYFPLNFDSTADNGNAGPIFKQLYFRQAMQYLMNQPGIIKGYYKGYGVPTYGPVPAYPKNSFTSSLEETANGPYPFNPQKAITLLKSHGWDVKPNGISTCAKPGTAATDCGANIKPGAQLNFFLEYYNGSVTLGQSMTYEVAQWALAGIHITTKAAPFNQVIAYATPCVPKVTPACQSWMMGNWGGGWIFSPDYLPTGEEIFATGAGSNSGDYNNAENNTLIHETNVSAARRSSTSGRLPGRAVAGRVPALPGVERGSSDEPRWGHADQRTNQPDSRVLVLQGLG